MKVIKGKLLVKFYNGKALQTEVDFGGGHKLEIASESRPEHWANSLAEVVGSGIEGINPGDIVGLEYKVIFDYFYKLDSKGNHTDTRIYRNEIELPGGEKVFLADQSFIFFKMEGDQYKALGNHIILEPIAGNLEYAKLEGVGMAVAGEKTKKGEAKYLSGNIEGVEPGDVLVFEDKYRFDYKFGGKYIIVLYDHYILGKKVEEVA